jgi:hypothetical protein
VGWHIGLDDFASLPWWAFVVTKMWVWFFVPLGIPMIGYAHAFGFSATLGMFKGWSLTNKNDGHTEKVRAVASALAAWFTPLLALLVGSIARSYM